MYNISVTKPKISAPMILMVGLGILITLSQNFIIGPILIFLSCGFIFMRTGIKFDKENNRFKKYTIFLGFTLGKWEKVPEIKYISLLRVKMARRSYSPSSRIYVQRASKNYSYRVNLVIQNNRKPDKLLSTSKDKAIEIGSQLGEYLDLKVFDSTSTDRKWIR